MLKAYFRNLYKRTMDESYALAQREIIGSLSQGGKLLDCGAGEGQAYSRLNRALDFKLNAYYGIEWSEDLVQTAQDNNINVVKGDLNKELQFPDNEFKCVYGLSVLEHLLYPCRYLQESYRVLDKGGSLIVLTPNISTYFTVVLLLLGRMPSSGPHPDSNKLLELEEIFKVSPDCRQPDAEADVPVHRHLIIFSYRVLMSYLQMIGFKEVRGYGFGLYPFPNFMQPVLEKIDPYHCHQMVFVARK